MAEKPSYNDWPTLDNRPGLTRREEILDAVRRGDMSPEAAEIEAVAGGYEPFEYTPTPQEYDPRHTSPWSLLMVIEWIRTKSLDAVRDVWDSYRAATRVWQSPLPIDGVVKYGRPIAGAEVHLRARSPATFRILAMSVLRDEAKRSGKPIEVSRDPVAEAFETLRKHAAAGRIEALGRKIAGEDRVQIIPATIWIKLVPVDLQHGVGVVQDDDKNDGFRDLVFDGSRAMELWPSDAEVDARRMDGLRTEADVRTAGDLAGQKVPHKRKRSNEATIKAAYKELWPDQNREPPIHNGDKQDAIIDHVLKTKGINIAITDRHWARVFANIKGDEG